MGVWCGGVGGAARVSVCVCARDEISASICLCKCSGP